MSRILPEKPEFTEVQFSVDTLPSLLRNTPDDVIPTALGVVVIDGRILSFDDPATTYRLEKRVILPEANIDPPYELGEITAAVPTRFNTESQGIIMGTTALLASKIALTKPRLYVPVKFEALPVPTAEQMPKGLRSATGVLRTPEEILSILAQDDVDHQGNGAQRRAIARKIIFASV